MGIDYASADGGGQGSAQNPTLYWGPDGYGKPGRTNQQAIASALGAPGPAPQLATQTVEGANQWLWQQFKTNPDVFNGVRYAMERAGLKPDTPQKVFRYWNQAVGLAATAYANGSYLNPMETIALMGKGFYGENGGLGKSGKYSKSFSRTTTSTDRAVDLSSAQEARAFLMAAAERELGRAPTADEIAAFRRALNEQERANPETTVTKSTSKGTTVSTYEDGQMVDQDTPNTVNTSSSTRTGGMDRGQFAVDVARSQKDWAEYQAATTYMNAMFQALSSPVGN